MTNELEQLGKWKYFFMVFLLAPSTLISLNLNNDIWFLLSLGRYISANGIPHIEPLTMHQNLNFVAHQWASSVIFWKIYSAFGAAGLILMCHAVFVLMVFLVFKLTKLVSNGNFPVSYSVTLFICIFYSFLFMTSRPHIFTTLFILTELYLLELYIRKKDPRYLIGLPVLSFLQVNLHAAMWPMLLVILLPYVIDGFSFRVFSIRTEGYGVKYLAAAAVAVIAAGLLNPYGFEAATYLFRSYGHKEISKLVTEMFPPDINTVIGRLIFGHALIFTAILCFFRKGRLSVRNACLVLGTGYMSLSSMRSWCFFIICSGMALSEYLKDLELKVSETPTASVGMRKKLLALIAVSFAAALTANAAGLKNINKSPESGEPIAYLESNGYLPENITLYMDYNEGGYGEFHGYKPYIDARADVFVIENNGVSDIMEEYYNLQVGKLHYKDFIENYGFTHIIAMKNDILYVYMPEDPDYRPIYSDENCVIYESKSFSQP